MTLSAAVSAATGGETIEVSAGNYINDFPPPINVPLTIEGMGGMAHFSGTVPVPNGKAILVTNTDVTLKNIELSGAVVDPSSANGAGIRYQGGNLVLENCYVHDNQEGLLGGAYSSGSITVSDSEFARNGVTDPSLSAGYGYTHNIYVGDIPLFTVNHSYFFSANVGHEIKSRALATQITDSVIADGASGTASYDIDLPNGAKATIQNNVIEKGPDAGNPVVISFGEEGGLHSSLSLSVSGNTVLNDLGASALFVRNDSAVTAELSGNSFYRMTASQIAGSGPVSVSGSILLTTEPYPDSGWTTTMPSPWPAP